MMNPVLRKRSHYHHAKLENLWSIGAVSGDFGSRRHAVYRFGHVPESRLKF